VVAKSTYVLADFITFCRRSPEKVYVFDVALKNAQEIFRLNTELDLLDFIANNGLEEIEPVNTKLWENNPDPTNKIYVDAYQFITGGILGYIAFFKNKNNDWVIKSFHLSNERSGIMENAIKTAQAKGYIK
jgi:hypothetical protein